MTAVDSDTTKYAGQDLYGMLHVTPDAGEKLIQYGYRLAARHAHPDAGGSPEVMQLLNKAKEILLDPQRRAAYDGMRCNIDRSQPGVTVI
jgi:DnaJ-class molecular chaperone